MQNVWSHRYDSWAVLASHYDRADDIIAECYRISATYSGPEGKGLLVQLPRFDTPSVVSEANIRRVCNGSKPAWLPKTNYLQT